MKGYTFWTVKRRLESIVIFPFILLGRLIALVYPADREYRIFFFFPFYHTGGAEKVHLQIAQVLGGPDCIIYFTRHSQGDTFRAAFAATGCHIRDISRFTDNKWIYFVNLVFRGILSGYINRQGQPPMVFQGHSNIAYKTAPWIRSDVTQIDLVHSMNSFSRIRIPFLAYYRRTVLISRVRLAEHQEYYRRIGVPEGFISRMLYISNAVEVPAPKRCDGARPFSVLFSGRNGPEKRLPLFLRIAQAVRAGNPDIRFQVMGVSEAEVDESLRDAADFLGNQSDPDRIWNIYASNDILLLTSETEGMPLAVIEAMGCGCAVLATPVGDLPVHVTNGEQGYVFSTASDEATILQEAVRYIEALASDAALLRRISTGNRAYYEAHFSMPAFASAYRSLPGNEKTGA